MIPVIAALLSAVAPALAETAAEKLFGKDTPMSDAAKGAVLSVAETVIGEKITDKTSAEEAGLQIVGDPAMKLEFQRLLNERLAVQVAADNARLKMELDDRANARARDIATNDPTGRHLAYAVFGVWALVNMVLLMIGTPQGVSEAILGRALGMIDGVTMLVASFHWGGIVRGAVSGK